MPTCLWVLWFVSPCGIAFGLKLLEDYCGLDKDVATLILHRYLMVGWLVAAIALAIATILWLPKLTEEYFGGGDQDWV